jgi:hypothetical protein
MGGASWVKSQDSIRQSKVQPEASKCGEWIGIVVNLGGMMKWGGKGGIRS